MKASILVIHLNGEKIIRECLDSIFKNSPKDIEVLVLFNATKDNSKRIVKEEFPGVKTFSSDKILSFAESCNFLAEKARAKYVVFLNNDTVVSKNWIESMLKTLGGHKNCVACQPKIKSYFERDKFEYAGAAGGYLDVYGFPFCRGRIFGEVEEDRGQYDNEVRIFWGCGSCLLVDKSFFKKLGGFDEDFQMYAEEIDFAWRANLAGKEIWFSPRAVIYHMGSYSIKKARLNYKKDFLISRNHFLLLLKNYSMKKLIKRLPGKIFLEAVSAVRFFPLRTVSSIRSLFAVPYIFLTKMIDKRKKIQNERKVEDGEIEKLMSMKSIAYLHFVLGKSKFGEIKLGESK